MPELKVVNIKDVKGERGDPPRVSWVLVSENGSNAPNLVTFHQNTRGRGQWVEPAERRSEQHAEEAPRGRPRAKR